jgi:hypothetical protein
MKRGGIGLGLAAALLLWAGAASALSFTMADVAFTVGGASGTIQLVGGSENAGPTGTTLSGTPGGSDDLLIFRVVMSSGSVVEVGAGIFLNFSTDSGTVAGAGVNVLNGAYTSTGASLRTFSFDTDGNSTADSLSGTSDSFWVTWASVADGAQVSFMINNGTTQQTFLGTINVPEPAGLLLVALGVGALAARRRFRG